MKDPTLFVNPEFLKFLEKSSYASSLQARYIAYALLIFYIGDLVYTVLRGNFFPAIIFICLSPVLWFGFRPLNFRLWFIKLAYLTSVYFWLVIIFQGFFPDTQVTTYFLPNISNLTSFKFLGHLSSVGIIMLTMAFVFGMSTVVMDLVKETLSRASYFSNSNNGNKYDFSVKAGFALLFFLSTYIVFRYFGDSLWDFTLDLLGDAAALDVFIAVMFIAFYCKLLIKDLSLKKPTS